LETTVPYIVAAVFILVVMFVFGRMAKNVVRWTIFGLAPSALIGFLLVTWVGMPERYAVWIGVALFVLQIIAGKLVGRVPVLGILPAAAVTFLLTAYLGWPLIPAIQAGAVTFAVLLLFGLIRRALHL